MARKKKSLTAKVSARVSRAQKAAITKAARARGKTRSYIIRVKLPR